MASILDITLSEDENHGIDSEDSDDGFKVCDTFTREPPNKKFRKESGESSPSQVSVTPVTPPLTPGPPEDPGPEPNKESISESQKKSSPVMKGPPTPASTPPPVAPPENESEIIEIDNEDGPTPATVNSALGTKGQLISE